MGHVLTPNLTSAMPGQLADDDVIPTAIVIKNIPFNVKREMLLDIIVSEPGSHASHSSQLLLGFSFYSDAVRVQLSS